MSAGKAASSLRCLGRRHANAAFVLASEAATRRTVSSTRQITTSASVSAQPTSSPIQHADPSLSIDGLTTTINSSPTSTEDTQPPHTVLTTIYSFPDMEPLRFAHYSTAHLHLPLRRDLLHRAIVYEGDSERQGTASTKWRSEVRVSGRKLAPQKGLGRARVGDASSPTRRGGGVAFGPKPRDFATGLPRKMYDLAWRTALSYRYRRGELLLVQSLENPPTTETWWSEQMFAANGWGRAGGKSLLVAEAQDETNTELFEALERDYDRGFGPRMAGRIKTVEDVDVKDMLSMGRIIIEHRALNKLLYAHSTDLVREAPRVSPLAV